MAKYFSEITQTLMPMGLLLALLYAFMSVSVKKHIGKQFAISCATGLLLSFIMGYFKDFTDKVNTGLWNLRIFFVSVPALVVFIVFALPVIKKKIPKVSELFLRISFSLLVITYIFYTMPDVLFAPRHFMLAGQSIVSTEFLFKLIGYIAAILLVAVTAFTLYKVAVTINGGALFSITASVTVINAVNQIMMGLSYLSAKRVIKLSNGLFKVMAWVKNNSDPITLLMCAAAFIIPVTVWIMSVRQKEKYDNPAQHRKIKAKWRKRRINAATVTVCFILTLLNFTAVKAYVNKPVEISPSEEFEFRDNTILVPLSQVEDGNLHRFTYTTKDGIGIRFIVIKKPGGSSYGIGLDACEICGETGYYQRGEQVICKLCDVVMNTSTIGFKGGCNPIPFEYKVSSGYIQIAPEALEMHKNRFK